MEALDLKEATLVATQPAAAKSLVTSGGMVTKRVAKAVLLSAVPPIMLRNGSNPEGLPIEVFDKLRTDLTADRSQFYKGLAILFYGANKPEAKVSQGILDSFWLWSMQCGLMNAYECIKEFSETDFTEDLKKFDVPTLVLHGEPIR